MKIEWDFTELYEFANKVNNQHDFETHIMTLTQQIARVLHHTLLIKTPVDTGNLRKMWSAGNNLYFTVEKKSNGYEVTLINDAQNGEGFKYGKAVNYGHKTPNGGWVMGRFFVENSIAETEEQLKTIVKHELQKWWSGVLNGK